MAKTHEYLSDAKLFGSIRVKAESERKARKILTELLDCATVNFAAEENGNAVIGEASLSSDGEPDLVEVDGEYPDFD